MTITKYTQRLDELKIQSPKVVDPHHVLAGFKSHLRFDIRKELLQKRLSSLEHAFQVVLDKEEWLQAPIRNFLPNGKKLQNNVGCALLENTCERRGFVQPLSLRDFVSYLSRGFHFGRDFLFFFTADQFCMLTV